MEFKENKEKLKEMLAPRPKVVEGDKLVNYQGMDAYTETLMKTVNNKLDSWSPDLDTTHDTIVGAINEVNDKAKYTDGLAGDVADSFPLSQATEGKVYKEPNSKKYYVCTRNYNGGLISVPNANFEEISVWKNRLKYTDVTIPFKNFSTYLEIGDYNFVQTVPYKLTTNKKIYSVQALNSEGLFEFGSLVDEKSFVCGQLISKNGFNEEKGAMKIRIFFK